MQFMGEGLPHLFGLCFKFPHGFFKLGVLRCLLCKLVAQVIYGVLVLLVADFEVTDLMLVLDDPGQNFLQISFSLQLLTLQQFLTLLVIACHFFSLLLEEVELVL
jgi:hypothetical protein